MSKDRAQDDQKSLQNDWGVGGIQPQAQHLGLRQNSVGAHDLGVLASRDLYYDTRLPHS